MTAMRASRLPSLWSGQEPELYPELLSSCRGQHGRLLHGLWHARQIAAWHRAWEHKLIDQVATHGGGMYTVPSTSEPGRWYVVWHYRLAPDGYLWICDCPASERGGVVCQHAFAAYLWRLRETFGWRLRDPLTKEERP
jgi:hypothetical protein